MGQTLQSSKRWQAGKLFAILLAIFFASPAFADSSPMAAKVGSSIITIADVKQVLASTPYGSQPAGSRKRAAFFNILSELINAELLYQEAMRQEIDGTAEYTDEHISHSGSLLASLYKQSIIAAIPTPTAKDVKAFAKKNSITTAAAKALMTSGMKVDSIDFALSNLYEKEDVKFSAEVIEPDKLNKHSPPLVTTKSFDITWQEVASWHGRNGGGTKELMNYLEQLLEQKLFTLEAERLNLDKSKGYKDAMAEYEHNLAVIVMRKKLAAELAPTAAELASYLNKNSYISMLPYSVSAVQITVNKLSKAIELKQRIENGENPYQLAMLHSVATGAKQNGGDVGQIRLADGVPSQLEKLLMEMDVGDVSNPIKIDGKYTIVKLVEQQKTVERKLKEQQKMARQAITASKLQDYLKQLKKKTAVQLFIKN